VPEPEPGFSDLLGGDTVIIALELIVGVRLLCYTKIQSSAGFKKNGSVLDERTLPMVDTRFLTDLFWERI